MKRSACLVLLALAGCMAPPSQYVVAPGDLPPIARDFRRSILAWAKLYYAEPASVRGGAISDPVLVRDDTGRLLWLVCIEADAALVDGGRTGLVRQAFGFAPNYVSAPLARNGATLTRQECDAPALTWRPFPELARI